MLPRELWSKISEDLSDQAILRAMLACKNWCEFFSAEDIWNKQLIKQFAFSSAELMDVRKKLPAFPGKILYQLLSRFGKETFLQLIGHTTFYVIAKIPLESFKLNTDFTIDTNEILQLMTALFSGKYCQLTEISLCSLHNKAPFSGAYLEMRLSSHHRAEWLGKMLYSAHQTLEKSELRLYIEKEEDLKILLSHVDQLQIKLPNQYLLSFVTDKSIISDGSSFYETNTNYMIPDAPFTRIFYYTGLTKELIETQQIVQDLKQHLSVCSERFELKH